MVTMDNVPAEPNVNTTCAGAETTLEIGVLNGEGIGREVIGAALAVLDATASRFGFAVNLTYGTEIGLEAKKLVTTELSTAVIGFCNDMVSRQGAILSGPGGGRYVYDLRRHFSLAYKVNPLTSFAELDDAARLKAKSATPVDILLIRENLEGIYQGTVQSVAPGEVAQTYYCTTKNVTNLLEIAAGHAKKRSQKVTVIVKRGGLPALSEIWEDCAKTVFPAQNIAFEMMDVDFAAYQMLQAPEAFDVIATPNCFGDILADIGGLFFGSRGLTYGASFTPAGFGVYQTNHGCAYDLAGKNVANPVGQIFSLAMLLETSFGLGDEADAIRAAVRAVWADGWRTADVMAPGCRLAGTDVMAAKISERLLQL
jgi:3-isopropylmalate dehydrogenase